MSEAVELHAHFGLSYVAATCPFCTNDEVAEKLRTTSDEAMLRTFASLTHRMHVARLKNDAVKELELRAQRDWVQDEILKRMSRDDLPRLSPTHAMEETWKPGERVELVMKKGPYGPTELRPGTVERIDRTYGYHESLVVAFDDGETRAINPDVMRHIRE